MDYVAIGCRCFFGLLFSWSAISKVSGRPALHEFVGVTRRLLKAGLHGHQPTMKSARRIGALVIVAEAAVPPLLAHPATARAGLGLALALLAVFNFAIGAAKRRGISTSCRCFGSSGTALGTYHIMRNATLAVIAAAGVATGPGNVGGIGLSGFAITLGASSVLCLVYARLDDLADLFGLTPGSQPNQSSP